MTYALIIVEKTGLSWPDDMYRPLHKMPATEGFERMNESAWLVNLDTHLQFLAGMVQLCQKNDLVHHVAFFDQKPAFTRAPKETS
jgi:hypothetical protein